MDASRQRVFISRAGADAPMAAEIGRILEAAGYGVTLQQWDFQNHNFMARMHDALAGGARVVALLSPEYLASEHCAAEWQNAIAGDPLNNKGRLVVLRVAECEPLGLLAGLAYWDLVPLRDNAALFGEAVLVALRGGDQRDSAPSGPYWRAARTILDGEAIRPASGFTGRSDQLAAIGAAFERSEVVALHGLGGVGKTTLAREYAWRARGELAIAWRLAAQTEDGIIADFVRLGAVLVHGFDKIDDQRAAAQQVKNNLLSGFAQPVLLVFDNLDDENLLRIWKPAQSARILVTARTSTWGGDVVSIALGAWSRDEAIDFLCRETGRADFSRDDAGAIADALGNLPLALAHAAAYLRSTRTVTPQAYVARVGRYLAQAPRGAEYERGVFATFHTAVAKAEEEAPGAAAVLCLLGFFGAEAVPDELLRQAAELYAPLRPSLPERSAEAADLRASLEDPILLDEALGTLDRLSLVAYDPKTQRLSSHRLVQAAARDLVGKDAPQWLESAASAIDAAFPEVDFANWAACDALLPHALAVAQRALAAGLEGEPLARLLGKSGKYLCERARVAEAMPLLEASHAMRERRYGRDHADTARSANAVGCAHYLRGDFEAAESWLKRGLEIREAVLGPEHPGVADSLNELAILYDDAGRYEISEQFYRRALAIWEKSPGSDPDVASALNNLGALLKNLGRYAEAEPIHERARAIMRRVHPPGHPNLAMNANNVASLYRMQGRFAEAETLHREALAIRENAFGPDHPDVAQSLNNLAALYHTQGRYEEAEPLLRRAIEMRERVLGPEHFDIVQPLNNLANVCRALGRLDEAEATHRRALALRERALGADHALIAVNLCGLGGVHVLQGRYEEAEPLYLRALAISEKQLGPNHPETATAVYGLAQAYRGTGREGDAVPLFERALAIRESALGPEHPETLAARASLNSGGT